MITKLGAIAFGDLGFTRKARDAIGVVFAERTDFGGFAIREGGAFGEIVVWEGFGSGVFGGLCGVVVCGGIGVCVVRASEGCAERRTEEGEEESAAHHGMFSTGREKKR